MPKIIKSLLAWVVVCLFLAYVFYFFYRNPEHLQRLIDLSPGQLVILLTLSLGAFMGLGLQLSISVLPYATHLSWQESLRLSVSNNLLNYSPIKSGAIAKGLYLKTVYRLRVHDYVQAMLAGQLLWIGLSAFIGALAGVFLLQVYQSSSIGARLLIVILLAAMSLAYGLLFLPQYLSRLVPLSKVRKFASDYADGIRSWRLSKGVFLNFALISGVLFVLFALRLWLAFQLGGEAITLIEAAFLQSCVAVGFAFSFVPGNLGLKEGALVGLAVLLGVDSEAAMLAAVLDRSASLVPTLILGPFFLHSLTKRMLSQEVIGPS